MKFSIKETAETAETQETADLVTFSEEVLNGNLYFLCSVRKYQVGHLANSSQNKNEEKKKLCFPHIDLKL